MHQYGTCFTLHINVRASTVPVFIYIADTVRAYKERMKLGRFNPEEQKRREVEKEKILKEEEQKMVDIQIGDRHVVCQYIELSAKFY